MKKLLILTVVLGLIFGITSFAKTDKKLKPQTKCPICKMDINKNLYVDYKGKRIYFGCQGCPAEFKKNPEKYIKQMEKEGIVLEKAPTTDKKSNAQMMANCKMHKMNMENKEMNMKNCKMNMKNQDKKAMMEMHKKMMKMHNFDMSKCTCTPEMKKKGQMCNYCKSMMDKWMSTNQNNQNTNSNKVKK